MKNDMTYKDNTQFKTGLYSRGPHDLSYTKVLENIPLRKETVI